MNTEYDLSDLLEEIQRSHFSLEYVKILASYFLKASESERIEINKIIKASSLVQPIQEYLGIPQEFTMTSSEFTKNLPSHYNCRLTEESQNLLHQGSPIPFSIKMVLSGEGISSYEEAPVNQEAALFDKLSSFWDNSKKQIAASLVVAALLTPALEISSHYFGGGTDAFSFQSEKNYAAVFNDGLKELLKSKSPRLNGILSELSDKEMKFFIKNLEAAHPLVNSRDKKIIEIQLAIDSYYHYKIRNSNQIAHSIFNTAEKNGIDPTLFLSIIKVESDFKQSATNSSGDLSLAQINYDIWSEEFLNQGKEPLDKKRLKEDLEYGVERMGEILSFLKERYSEKDPIWYARYHNRKPQYKNKYAIKVNRELSNLGEMKMDLIASKLLDMKQLALKLAEIHPEIDYDKVNKMVTALEQIEQDYQVKVNTKSVIASND